MRVFGRLILFGLVIGLAGVPAHAQEAPPQGQPELVASFGFPMPTGVTVSQEGRIFISLPRWTDKGPYTAAEVLPGGQVVPFPSAELNRFDPTKPADTLVSVQSVVVDPNNRLWLLDTGSINFAPVLNGGPKLVGIDLRTNQIVKTIFFPLNVALRTTYLNDVRFDLRRGAEGVAYITDSSGTGPNAIIVVDLATGASYRRLNDHPSTKAAPQFAPQVEGRPLLQDEPDKPPQYLSTGADGIALSADGSRLFYTPLASRHLYSVSTDALLDPARSDAEVATTVVDHLERPGASDGLEADAQGRLYLTDYEYHAVRRWTPGAGYETLFEVQPFEWADTLSLAADGHLYLMTNQLHRQPSYQDGKDLRQPPYRLYRVKTDSTPVLLR